MKIQQTKIKGLKYEKRYENEIDNKDWINCKYDYFHDIIEEEFSPKNKIILLNCINQLKEKRSFNNILEIGVFRSSLTHNKQSSSTQLIIDNKPKETKYLGIDINANCINSVINLQENIYGLCCRSEMYIEISEYMQKIQMDKIDLLMIDGNHSINQVFLDFRFAEKLSDNGIVFFHDTNYHPGPKNLLDCIDENIYDIHKYYENEIDWGVAYLTKK